MHYTALLAFIAAAAIGVTAMTGTVRAKEEDMTAETTMMEKAPVAKLAEISGDDLKAMIDGEKAVVIFDSRGADKYAAGHIPGAFSLRADDVTAEKLAELVPSKDTALVFYCGNRQCPASAKTAHKAATAGYTNILKYTDGMEDWTNKGFPVAAKTAE